MGQFLGVDRTERDAIFRCGPDSGGGLDRKVCLCVCEGGVGDGPESVFMCVCGGASFQNCQSKYSLQNSTFGSKHILFSLYNLTILVYFLLIYIIRVKCTFKAF